MRTRGAILGCFIWTGVLLGGVLPCVAAADVLVVPPPPKVVTTVPATATSQSESPKSEGPSSEGVSPDVLYGVAAFLGPLLLTLLVEVPVVAVAGRGSAAAWKTGVLVNTLTNPAAVLAAMVLVPAFLTRSIGVSSLAIGLIELVVVVVEWRVFRWVLGWSHRRAIVTSVIANGLSFGLGLVLIRVSFGF
jgi:hypothetical protein